MTRKIVIASRLSDYTVFFEDRHDFLSELKAKNAIWIIDRNVLRLYPGYFSDIPEGSLIDFDAVDGGKCHALRTPYVAFGSAADYFAGITGNSRYDGLSPPE